MLVFPEKRLAIRQALGVGQLVEEITQRTLGQQAAPDKTGQFLIVADRH